MDEDTGEEEEIEDLREAEQAEYSEDLGVCLIVVVFFDLDHHDLLNRFANGNTPIRTSERTRSSKT